MKYLKGRINISADSVSAEVGARAMVKHAAGDTKAGSRGLGQVAER